ncbi:class D beta-lactamase [Geomesophilobacter sediminis]|nr:class D beta-lactamase [Geomesophilobacter sediminis]
MARLFNEKNIQGTIVISSLDGTTTYSHNDTRAATRMLPASTFKIPNTLIALEEGAIADETQVLKWDGKVRSIAVWNKDQTVESAFKSSCVWVYQELAQRIGTARYESYLTRIGYGNARPTPVLTTFWLEGDLRISALEQIAFLKRLYRREFPFKPASYDVLKRIMIVEQTPTYTVHVKTGWANFGATTAPQIGWYVGYLETKGNVWLFALNMDISKPADAGLRQKIVMEALKSKGIL